MHHVRYLGPAGGRVIWAGNAVGGFELRATCPGGLCMTTAGIRLTFEPPVTAAGADYPGGTDAVAFDAAGAMVSSQSVTGSGLNFLGYQAAVRLGRVEYTDPGGENEARLVYHRCAP